MELGVDLAVWWRARRWAALLELIDQLPPTSRLNEALRLDPDRARLHLDREEQQAEAEGHNPDPWRPSLREWNLQAVMTARLIHAMETVSAQLGGRTEPPQAFPGPRTALDELRDARSRQGQLAIIAIATPSALDDHTR